MQRSKTAREQNRKRLSVCGRFLDERQSLREFHSDAAAPLSSLRTQQVQDGQSRLADFGANIFDLFLHDDQVVRRSEQIVYR